MTTTIDKPVMAITQYNAVRAEVAELAQLNASLVFKYDDPKDNKNARSHIFKLRTKKGDIERVRKEAKADALDYGRRVDAVAKELTGELDSMIDVHQKPIDAIDAIESARLAEEERKRLEVQAAIEKAERDKREAALAAERAEAERIRAERDALLQQQREEQIRREAAERAVQEEREVAATLEREKREAEDRRVRRETERLKNERVREAIVAEIALSICEETRQTSIESASVIARAMLDGKIARVTVRTNP